ncbi:MAG TPA: glutamate-cysteine ligase family protein [Polyangiaceae bacterium]
MGVTASEDEQRPIRDRGELTRIFSDSEKPASAFRIGAEAEKFAVVAATGAPIDYEHGITAIFARLEQKGWQPEREAADGPVIALRRGPASITLEPGAQLELSGAALPDLHLVSAELDQHLAELKDLSVELGLAWLSVGFHPLAAQSELPWVPKQRYAVMKQYLPERGRAAHDMMRRTATVQANFDYASEEDALRKLTVTLRLGPLIHALSANAPFSERRRAPVKSLRGEVWLHMDPSRSGLVPPLWKSGRLGYRDYVEWALDAGMFLFKRGERVFYNTGQTFRSFLADGFSGERATFADWRMHLNTLFPEARLKNTIEARSCDAQRHELGVAVPALFTGLLYDERALAEAEELARSFDLETLEASRPAFVRDAIGARYGDRPLRGLAERVLEIANGGLARRGLLDANGRDETHFLAPLAALVGLGCCPADVVADGVSEGAELAVADLIERTRLRGPLDG